MFRRSVFQVLLLAAVGSTLEAQGVPADTVWPAPPEPARVRYAGALRSDADLGRREGFLTRFTRRLTGGGRANVLTIERPFDVLATADRLYVTNGTLRAVVMFDRGQRRGRLLGADVPGGLSRPMGLGGDAAGRVYVADPGARRVVVMGPDGGFLRAFGGVGVLANPVDVAVDAVADRIYVVDSYLHQIVVFDSTGSVQGRIGRQVGLVSARARPVQDSTPAADSHGARGASAEPSDVWENRGGEPGEFRYPFAAAVGPDGTLFVADQMNFRVQAFDRRGDFVRQFGRLGDTPGSFTRPKGVAVNSAGHVYVVDAAFNNVQVFDAEGRLLLSFGSLGHGPGQLWMPLGISIDPADRIVVADRYNNRAQLFQYLPLPDAMPVVESAGRADP